MGGGGLPTSTLAEPFWETLVFATPALTTVFDSNGCAHYQNYLLQMGL